MIDTLHVFTILLMACATYVTRVAGFLIARAMPLGSRASALLESAPGCILISVIAPRFVAGNTADLLSIAITVVAAARLSLLPTVAISVTSAAVLRDAIG